MEEKMQKRENKNLKMKNWVKIHATFVAFLFVFYVSVGIFGGLNMLGNDLQQKFAWASTSLSVFVDALPDRPILSVTTSCVGNVSTVNLVWIQSDGATSYTVNRDGNILVSGFQTMAYADSTVIFGNNYTYIVTASGSSGDAISDSVTVSAKDCTAPPLPDPIVTLVSFDGKEVFQGNALSTINSKFKITGTTNVPNANIQISTLPGPQFVSTLQANSNGYWDYSLPGDLVVGSYSFQLIVTDPDEPSRSVIQNYPFEILKKPEVVPVTPPPPVTPTPPSIPEPVPAQPVASSPVPQGDNGSNSGNDKNNNDNDKKSKIVISNTVTNGGGTPPGGTEITQPANGSSTPPEIQVSPIPENMGSITMFLKNKNNKVYQSQDAEFDVYFNNFGKLLQNINMNTVDMRYEILNVKGVSVFSSDVTERIFGSRLEKNIHVPSELPFGNYKIRVSVLSGEQIVSAESSFAFAEMPIVSLGGGYEYAYSQMLSQIGWLLIIAMLLLLFFGFMFLLEYYFFKKSIFTVAEEDLAMRGMISIRKEVST